MQLIPSLDLMQGRLVRLRHGDPKQATFYDLDPEDWIGSLVEAGARRIHLVDLDGAFGKDRQGQFTAFPVRFPEIRFQLGGGLRDREAIEGVLDLGFDAVVGTLAVDRPLALRGLSGERVIAALDLKGERIVTRGWQTPSASAAAEVFEALLALGFNRALVTDVSRDGTLEGPGLEAAAWVAKQGFQVQASGGMKALADLAPLAKIPGVVGAICGKALMEGFILLDDPGTRRALAGSA
jgi:phosphoribosylformimino-5-aminoimidazole carboxamide ribotide isomerase